MNFSKRQFSHTIQQRIILGFFKITFLNEKINNVFILKRSYSFIYCLYYNQLKSKSKRKKIKTINANFARKKQN